MFKLYFKANHGYQNLGINSFPNEVVIDSLKTFESMVSTTDYIFGKCNDGYDSNGKWTSAYRKGENWVCSDCLFLDFDDGLSIADFTLRMDKYEWYLTTSRSHQKDKHGVVCDRYHVIFPINKTISDKTEYFLILQGLGETFFSGEIDTACIDVVRFFFANNETICIHHEGVCIFDDIKTTPPEKTISNIDKRTINTEEVFDTAEQYWMMKYLKEITMQNGFSDYDDWVALGMALKTSGFSVDNFIQLSDPDAEKEAEYKWKTFHDNGPVGMGTLFYFLKQFDFLEKYRESTGASFFNIQYQRKSAIKKLCQRISG